MEIFDTKKLKRKAQLMGVGVDGGDFGEIVDILLLSCLLGRTRVGGGAGNTRMIAKGHKRDIKK